MGSKNRIFLGYITLSILHILRNIFKNDRVYITKAKLNKIKHKHKEIFHFFTDGNFQRIIDNTIGICSYRADDNLINFIAILDDEIFLYSVSPKNFYIHLGTFFKSDKRKIVKQCSGKIKFLDQKREKIFREFL